MTDLSTLDQANRNLVNLGVLEHLEYALVRKGDFKRSHALEIISGLNTISHSDEYLEILSSSEDDSAQKVCELLKITDPDVWAQKVDEVVATFSEIFPHMGENILPEED